MTQSTYPPVGQQPYGQQYGQQPYGQPGFGPSPAPFGQPASPYGHQPPKKKTGLIIGSVLSALVLIGGLVVGGILLFGTSYVDAADAERQLTAFTEEQAGVTPADVSCPTDVELEAGATFSCSASLEGQPITYTVTQTDDEGNAEFALDNTVVPVAAVEEEVSAQIAADIESETGVDVQLATDCDTGDRTLLVDPAGTTLDCTVTNLEDTSRSIQVTATVAEDTSVSYEVQDA
ncbi:DUF4333 domain-containing protein [Blastococcus sp. SYSU D00669]